MNRTWCILGGGGSFGIHTALHLLQNTDDLVIGVGRFPLRSEPFTLGVDKHQRYTYRSLHIGSELDLLLEFLDETRPQIIVNFAAQGEGAASWRHSWRFFDTNATALVRLAEELSKRTWLERFIQIGSSEVYGSTAVPASEASPIRPTSPYAASKVAFDLYLQAVATRGFPMTLLRPSNAYGPGQQLHRLIPRAVLCGLTGKRLPLQGGGYVEKSYIHSADLARAIRLVGESDKARGQTYNVGPARPAAIREVCERIAAALGMPFAALVEEVSGRVGEDARYWLDSSKIYNELGWKPAIGWDEGLTSMFNWGRTHLDEIRDRSTDYELRA